MDRKKRAYILSVLLVEAAGFAVGMLTREGTQLYATSIDKPPLSPPGIVFPVVWTVLYALMGIGLARVILTGRSPARATSIRLFAFQLLLNLSWCFIFFDAQNYVLALVELVLMQLVVVPMVVAFNSCDPLAAKLQLPYLLWLCFATYLNIGVIVLN